MVIISIFSIKSYSQINYSPSFKGGGDKILHFTCSYIIQYNSYKWLEPRYGAKKAKEKKNKKLKKQEYLNLELEKNIDILNYVSKHNSLRPKLVIGFAAETNDMKENAHKKLFEKNCDWIIANNVSNNSIGFDSDYNEVSIFYKDKEIKNEELTMKKKSEISEEIADRVIKQLN